MSPQITATSEIFVANVAHVVSLESSTSTLVLPEQSSIRVLPSANIALMLFLAFVKAINVSVQVTSLIKCLGAEVTLKKSLIFVNN